MLFRTSYHTLLMEIKTSYFHVIYKIINSMKLVSFYVFLFYSGV